MARERELRLWPGVGIAAIVLAACILAPLVMADSGAVRIFGGGVGGLLIYLWWLLFSRARWQERIGALAATALAMAGAYRIVDESIRNGMMGMLYFLYAIPIAGVALVGWAVASSRFFRSAGLVSLAVTVILACGSLVLLRTGGITGDANSEFAWRWSKTPEQLLLAAPLPVPKPVETPKPAAVVEPVETAPAVAPVAAVVKAAWPGFRGPRRDGVVHGSRIRTDWAAAKPAEIWRRAVGPGWSSFSVNGELFYTQEQRGEEEIVACYRVATGEPVWMHRDAARFWESNGGAGPRATPTVSGDRVYTFGATGILNALDAATGAVIWTQNTAVDVDKKVPTWGFAGSPLVAGNVVVVAAAGTLAGYDAATGARRWTGPAGGTAGYSSPHWAELGGTGQILLLRGTGIIGVAPEDGKLLWEHKWPGDGIVQPAVTADGDVLLGAGSGMSTGNGVRRIAVTHGEQGWSVEERWTSNGLKPYFNDFVVHNGHAFGFDGSILSCIDLADGKRKWKGGRYGHGQLILLADQGVLLVLAEEGELALVEAGTERHVELARAPGIEGKTWNHPVLAGDVLLVRNDREMAAFRLR